MAIIRNKAEMVQDVMNACLEGDYVLLNRLFKKYPTEVFVTRGRDGMTFIHRLAHSAGANPLQCLEVMLDNGVSVNARDYKGATPLIHASDTGHDSLVSLLVDRGASLDLCDVYGDTAIIRASDRLWMNVMSHLAVHGADLSIRNKNGDSAQSICMRKSNTDEMVKEFLSLTALGELHKLTTIPVPLISKTDNGEMVVQMVSPEITITNSRKVKAL